jgi:hypothetical protein
LISSSCLYHGGVSDPFRDSEEAHLRRIEALENENAELRRALDQKEQPRPAERRNSALVLLFVASGTLAFGILAAVVTSRSRTVASPPIEPTAPAFPYSPAPTRSAVPELRVEPVKYPTKANLFGVTSDGRETWVVGDRGEIADGSILFAFARGEPFDIGKSDAGGPTPLRAVTRDFAVGDRGLVLARDVRTWSAMKKKVTVVDLLGVATVGRYVYAVGRKGVVLRLGPESPDFLPMESGTTRDLHAVAGAPDGDAVVAVGDAGAIVAIRNRLRAMKEAWKTEQGIVADDLRGVTWDDGGFVAVGRNGAITRGDGEGHWRPETAATDADLFAVVATSVAKKTTAIAVGAGGVIVIEDTPRWRALESGTKEDLFALHGDPLWIVGAHGTVLGRGE